jgi:lipopolysaccharide/colanic/teichoic acid biosynthesis glycosyltransferase
MVIRADAHAIDHVWRSDGAGTSPAGPSRWTVAMKRAMDCAVALVLIVALLPLMSVIALAVLVGDGGPVTFRQRRIGRAGVPFGIIKFRTMVTDAEARLESDRSLYQEYVANGHKLANRDDPRVTRVGRFLRSTSLDELPQLFNVLAGSMSLVGPRPVLHKEVTQYYRDDAAIVHAVRPGMTGLWQVSGRDEIDYPERVAMDVAYVTDWNLRGDLAILVRTVGAVATRRGVA